MKEKDKVDILMETLPLLPPPPPVHGQVTPPGDDSKKVTITSLGLSSFDLYGLKHYLPNLANLIWCTNGMHIAVTLLGNKVNEWITRVTTKDAQLMENA